MCRGLNNLFPKTINHSGTTGHGQSPHRRLPFVLPGLFMMGFATVILTGLAPILISQHDHALNFMIRQLKNYAAGFD